MRVVQIVKHGHKIVDYRVVDNNGQVADLNKAAVTKLARNNMLSNCKLQIYNGCDIIRIKEGTYITTEV